MKTTKIVLRSCNPSEYPDLELECKELENEEIGAYLATISESKKTWGYKSAPVAARKGEEGEVIHTVLTTEYEGRKYILSEETGTVKVRDGHPDVVVKNISSTSNEEYIVKAAKFASTYTEEGELYAPVPEPRLLTEVPETVVITTSWGAKAVCLKGSYIVTYDAATNDYNTLERGAKESTYTTCEPVVAKTLQKK